MNLHSRLARLWVRQGLPVMHRSMAILYTLPAPGGYKLTIPSQYQSYICVVDSNKKITMVLSSNFLGQPLSHGSVCLVSTQITCDLVEFVSQNEILAGQKMRELKQVFLFLVFRLTSATNSVRFLLTFAEVSGGIFDGIGSFYPCEFVFHMHHVVLVPTTDDVR